MNVGVMQPYLLPYIGYWQLISYVDTFVIYDDVNYINKGYINRNNILTPNGKHRFTLELIGASQNKLINEISIGNNSSKILKTIEMSYKKAPFFIESFPLIEDIFKNKEKNLAFFLGDSIIKVSHFLDVTTNIVYSSRLDKDNTLKLQEKIVNICNSFDAKQYTNPIGGVELYDKNFFKQRSIKLNFIESNNIYYEQFKNSFESHLSIIDIIMFNSKDTVKSFLKEYKIIG